MDETNSRSPIGRHTTDASAHSSISIMGRYGEVPTFFFASVKRLSLKTSPLVLMAEPLLPSEHRGEDKCSAIDQIVLSAAGALASQHIPSGYGCPIGQENPHDRCGSKSSDR
jgi:hypothetical protein